jgi:DNA-directed RNA polymerase subunit RPC12/RpoP
MKLVECTPCGSKELFEENGYIVCEYCRSRFAPQAGDAPPRETVIGVQSDIQVLLRKCKDDPANRHRYASLILDIDPTNYKATDYLR